MQIIERIVQGKVVCFQRGCLCVDSFCIKFIGLPLVIRRSITVLNYNYCYRRVSNASWIKVSLNKHPIHYMLLLRINVGLPKTHMCLYLDALVAVKSDLPNNLKVHALFQFGHEIFAFLGTIPFFSFLFFRDASIFSSHMNILLLRWK